MSTRIKPQYVVVICMPIIAIHLRSFMYATDEYIHLNEDNSTVTPHTVADCCISGAFSFKHTFRFPSGPKAPGVDSTARLPPMPEPSPSHSTNLVG